MTGRSRFLSLCAISLAVILAGCGIPFRSPTASPPTVPPTAENLGALIVPTETPTTSYPPTARIATPAATRTVSITLQPVAFDPALDVLPGDWAPDGSALVAFVLFDMVNRGPIGRLWTVDPGSASPLWDSGDMNDLVGQPVAEWLPDSTLVLARTDAMRVQPDGSSGEDVVGIEGQIRYVDVSPDGQTIFAVGPDGAWLIGVADGQARRVQADVQTWDSFGSGIAWSPDSRFVAVNHEGDFIVDAATAIARSIGGEPACCWDPELPIWFRDGWVSFVDIDHMVNADTDETQSRDAFFGADGLSERRVSVHERGDYFWGDMDYQGAEISPDRRYIFYHELGPPVPNTAFPGAAPIRLAQASFLRDLIAGTTRAVELISTNAYWAPTSDRYAVLSEAGLAVFAADKDEKIQLLGPDRAARHFEWSPDGRWMTVYDRDGTLWLIDSDGGTEPIKVVEGHAGSWDRITWSPDSRRFAVAVPNPEVLAATAEAAAATSTPAPADATATAPSLVSRSVPTNLVLVTIEEGMEE